jgi:hypothetical protein
MASLHEQPSGVPSQLIAWHWHWVPAAGQLSGTQQIVPS